MKDVRESIIGSMMAEMILSHDGDPHIRIMERGFPRQSDTVICSLTTGGNESWQMRGKPVQPKHHISV
jgi:hypothetical protein